MARRSRGIAFLQKPIRNGNQVVLELKTVFEQPGEVLPVAYEMDLSGYELYGVHPFITPVEIRGRVWNEAGVVTLSYTAAFRLRVPCDRCLEPFERDYSYSFEEILVLEESEEHDEYIAAPGARLDLDELCLSDLLLSLPYKQLCDLGEDCKGLCPRCGANLNHVCCECGTSEADPRLAVLQDLLE